MLVAVRPPQRTFVSVAFGQGEVVAVVALADGVVVGGGREALGRVGANRFEHPHSGRCVRAAASEQVSAASQPTTASTQQVVAAAAELRRTAEELDELCGHFAL